MTVTTSETIAAIATAPGKGGVGVIRVSGPKAAELGQALAGRNLPEREAVYAQFKDQNGNLLDAGLAIYFAGPRSFTGEDVVEFHGHGGPVILDTLIAELISLGARQARAGEFSERAFLNDKIDLVQAEAIADLIDSTTAAAARGAAKSMQGAFSEHINKLQAELIELRVYVEAAIDFPEEEIDFLADDGIRSRIDAVIEKLHATLRQAGQGAILRNGLTVVLAGKPNAGKSSLLNALAGEQTAIVTDVPGTTRDVIRQTISLDGLPVHLVDTAGLRDATDQVEQIGVQRALEAIEIADHVLYLVDSSGEDSITDELMENDLLKLAKSSLVFNKIDLLDDVTEIQEEHADALMISVHTSAGLDDLSTRLKTIAGFQSETETTYTARRRHLVALENALSCVTNGKEQLMVNNAGELLADDLRQAQEFLSQITGEFSADDLLGEIFAGFCIGK